MKSLGLAAVSAVLLVFSAFAMNTAVDAAHPNELATEVVGKEWADPAAHKQ